MGIFRNTNYNAVTDYSETSYIFEEESGLNSSFILTQGDQRATVDIDDYSSGANWQMMRNETAVHLADDEDNLLPINHTQYREGYEKMNEQYGQAVVDSLVEMDGDQIEQIKDTVVEMGELSEILKEDPITKETPDKKVAGHILNQIQEAPMMFTDDFDSFVSSLGDWMQAEGVVDIEKLSEWNPDTERDRDEYTHENMSDDMHAEYIHLRAQELAYNTINAVTSTVPVDPHDMIAGVFDSVPKFTGDTARNLFKDVIDTAKKGKLSYEAVSKKLINC